MKRRTYRPESQKRTGATIVEMAVVTPVFAVFLAAIMEFGHAFLVVGTLNAAAKQAARYGAVDGITTAEVRERVDSILGAAFDTAPATVYVKDASVFDTASPPSTIDYSALTNIELASAARRQLYVVRIEVDYDDVALMPPFWAKNVRLVGQSVMRHE
jgi:Flp pilus assembly protein TadG